MGYGRTAILWLPPPPPSAVQEGLLGSLPALPRAAPVLRALLVHAGALRVVRFLVHGRVGGRVVLGEDLLHHGVGLQLVLEPAAAGRPQRVHLAETFPAGHRDAAPLERNCFLWCLSVLEERPHVPHDRALLLSVPLRHALGALRLQPTQDADRLRPLLRHERVLLRHLLHQLAGRHGAPPRLLRAPVLRVRLLLLWVQGFVHEGEDLGGGHARLHAGAAALQLLQAQRDHHRAARLLHVLLARGGGQQPPGLQRRGHRLVHEGLPLARALQQVDEELQQLQGVVVHAAADEAADRQRPDCRGAGLVVLAAGDEALEPPAQRAEDLLLVRPQHHAEGARRPAGQYRLCAPLAQRGQQPLQDLGPGGVDALRRRRRQHVLIQHAQLLLPGCGPFFSQGLQDVRERIVLFPAAAALGSGTRQRAVRPC
mmetsp:Transcript_14104/g.25287  ORF Transcript_14104/g.25287 Transcript_14104/m.25287 type:complete len:426 (+) Transcript_14104:202-1479(+)